MHGSNQDAGVAIVRASCPHRERLEEEVRLGMVIASPILAVICNIIRLIPTVWLYGYRPLNMANHFHDVSGWLMPPVAFLALLGIVRLLRWAMIPVTRFTLAYQ